MKLWPITPRFISLKVGCSEESTNLNAEGIFYPDYIRGFLGDSSLDSHIKNPLTLFQCIPQEIEVNNFNKAIKVIPHRCTDQRLASYLGNRKLIRIDTDNLYKYRSCCAIFRTKENNDISCQIQDSRIIFYFAPELDQFDVREEKDFEGYKNTLTDIINKYNETIIDPSSYIKIATYENSNEKRLYLSYICPKSCLKEYLFPVYSQGKIIACLVQGQIIHQNLKKTDIFKNYLIGFPELEQTVKDIEIQLPTPQEERNRIASIFKRISFLEERIKERIDSKSLSYISMEFAHIKKDFSEAFSKLSFDDKNFLDEFRKILSSSLREISHQFNNSNSFIRIFAFPLENQGKFILIGSSDATESPAYNDYYFSFDNEDYKQLIDYKENSHTDSKADPLNDITQMLLQAASPHIQSAYAPDDILRIQKTIFPKMSFIIWKRYTDWNKIKGTKAYEDYCQALFSFYDLIFQSYAFARGAYAETMLERLIQISNHEAGQILPALVELIYLDFIKPPTISLIQMISSGLFYKKIDTILNQLDLLDGIYTRPSLIFKDLEPENEWIDLFDFLKKINSLFYTDAKFRYQKINCFPDNLENVDLFVDRKYFDHILYNLIENAVKYGYQGSNIYVYAYTYKKDFRIDVVSYGFPIDNNINIYDLFIRGNSPIVLSAKGMGIGMFLAQKLCHICGGSLTHSSTPVFMSHLPACYYYKLSQPDVPALNENIKMKLDSAMNGNEWKSVVNVNSGFKPGESLMQSLVNMPTYKNCFHIILPLTSVRKHIIEKP